MREAAAQAAKEAVESLLKTEITSLPGCDRHECSGRNSGDSRNGNCQRTIQASLGPITIDVPRDRNGRYEPIAIPKYKRKTDLIVSTAASSVALLINSMAGERPSPMGLVALKRPCSFLLLVTIARIEGYLVWLKPGRPPLGVAMAGFFLHKIHPWSRCTA